MSSFGEDLKRERELRKISLREIAESTKINIRYLDALENNDFKRLPGGVFNKGFVRAYAQHIGVDEEDMVNAYLLEEQARGGGAGTVDGEPLRGNYGERFNTGDDLPADPGGARSRKRILLAVLGVVLLAAAVAVGWKWLSGRTPAPAEPEPAPQAVDRPAPARALPDPVPQAEQPEEAAAPEETAAQPEPEPEPEAAEPPAAQPWVEITLARPTGGRLNCDNRQVEMLDRLAAGITLRFRCERFLLVDADDGGALLVSTGGAEPVPMADDGVPLRQYRLTPEPRVD